MCQQGWTGDGRDCSVINNCLLPSAGGCHESAACLYIGPGQVGVTWQRAKGKQDSCSGFSPVHRSPWARTYCSLYIIYIIAVTMVDCDNKFMTWVIFLILPFDPLHPFISTPHPPPPLGIITLFSREQPTWGFFLLDSTYERDHTHLSFSV